MRFQLWAAIAVMAVICSAARADEPQTLISNGGFEAPFTTGWRLVGGNAIRGEVVDASVGGRSRAVHVESDPPESGNFWERQIAQEFIAPVASGDYVTVQLWMRSSNRSKVTVIVEQSAAPNTKLVENACKLTPLWKEYRFLGKMDRAYAAGEARFGVFVGEGKADIELAGVRVEDRGQAKPAGFETTIDLYGGEIPGTAWRAAAQARIEKIRKGDLVIHVVDAHGKPVSGARVQVVQQRHLFRFGTAGPAALLLATSPDARRYQAEVKRLFNTFTFENDLKWATKGDWTWPNVDKAARWLHDNGLEVRGHCLVWGSWEHIAQPDRDLRGPQLAQAIRAHVRDYAGHMRGKVYLWDVVNEARNNVQVWDSTGWDLFADVYKVAHDASPETHLCYNDYSICNGNAQTRAKSKELIKYLIDRGAPLTTLGDQSHIFLPAPTMDQVLTVWNDWAKFGKRLEVTEFDLGCTDDKLHAEYVRDFLTAAFSHPAMQSFIMWGFWEGSHWRANEGGAMFRRDWSKRPAQDAYEDLVLHQWWTRAALRTDARGHVALRAFYGRQRVTAAAAGKTVTTTVELVPGPRQSVTLTLR